MTDTQTTSRPRRMIARYDGTCTFCEGQVFAYRGFRCAAPHGPLGCDRQYHEVYFDPDTRTVSHVGCFADAHPLPDDLQQYRANQRAAGQRCASHICDDSIRLGQPIVYDPATGEPVHYGCYDLRRRARRDAAAQRVADDRGARINELMSQLRTINRLMKAGIADEQDKADADRIEAEIEALGS